MKNFIFILLLIFSGCSWFGPFSNSVGTVAQGYVMWKKGEATKYYNRDIGTTYRSVKHAADTLNLKITSDKMVKNEYHLKVGEKDKFQIKIVPTGPNLTQVIIRVNFMGDRPYAELFYKTVDDNLNSIYFKDGKPVKKFNL